MRARFAQFHFFFSVESHECGVEWIIIYLIFFLRILFKSKNGHNICFGEIVFVKNISFEIIGLIRTISMCTVFQDIVSFSVRKIRKYNRHCNREKNLNFFCDSVFYFFVATMHSFRLLPQHVSFSYGVA